MALHHGISAYAKRGCRCGPCRAAKSTYQRAWRSANPQERTPEFYSWAGARTRTTNPNTRGWANYGGRGIAMCDRWLKSFAAFLADMGPRPSPDHTLDRIDNDGPYAPWNCRWATWVEQAANRRPKSRRKAVVAA